MGNAPGKIHYRQQYVRCGKQNCRVCTNGPGHGPYWYAVSHEGNRTRSRYIGKTLPAGVDLVDVPATAVAGPPGDAPRRPAETLEPAVQAPRRHAGHAPRPADSVPPAPPSLRIWTLGQFRVESAGMVVPDKAWRRQAATVVLKLLLLADYHRLPREHIAGHLWPDAEPAVAAEALTGAIHALRHALEPGLAGGARSRYIVQEGFNLVLRLGREDWVDYLNFEQRLAASARAADPLADLEAAAALYGGDLLPDEQNVWCTAAREALRMRWQGMLLGLAEAQVTHRQVDAAAATLGRLLTADPAHEEAGRRLMGMLGRQGRRVEALRLYGRLEEALEEELGTEPAPETDALARALRAGQPPPRKRGARPAEGSAAETAPTRTVPELVGRLDELERLRAALLTARDGRGGAFILTGEAGIGKTRIVEETATAATLLGFTVLVGRAVEGEQDLPYAPMAEALRAYVRSRPPAALRRDLAGAEALGSLLPDLAAILPDLPSPAPLEHAGAERLRLWTAVRTLLVVACAGRPVLLVLEDLHWMDEASLGLIGFLNRRSGDLRLLVLGTLWDSATAGSTIQRLIQEGRRQSSLEVLALSGLSPDQVGALAYRQLGAPLPDALVHLLHAQCAGNPLFVVELLSLLHVPLSPEQAETEVASLLAGEGDLPITIRQVLSRRLDRLTPACRALLQACAVLGAHCGLDLLAEVAAQDGEALEGALDEALEAGVLQVTYPTAGVGYDLVHALLRRGIYAALPHTVRLRLHARAAPALERLVLAGRESRAALIAHHYVQCADYPAAAIWLERAGDQAAAVFAGAEAMAHYTMACRPLAGAGPGPSELERARLVRLHEKLGSLRMLDGEYLAALNDFVQARSLADDRPKRTELWLKEGLARERRGEFDLALSAFDAAERESLTGTDIAYDQNISPLHAELELSRGEVYRVRGDYQAAQAAARRALPVLNSVSESSALARVHYLLGRIAQVHGDYAGAEDAYRASLAVRERIGDLQGMATSWYGLGQVAYDRGDLKLAAEQHRRSLAARERVGDQWGIAFSWSKLGLLAQYQGDYPQAEECYRRSLAIRERIDSEPGLVGAVYDLGQAAHERGDYAEAADYYQRCLLIQERIGDQRGISNSLGELGEIARERGDLNLAEDYLLRGLTIKERLGDQLGLVILWTDLGRVAFDRGHLAAGIVLAGRARRLARRIGVRGNEAWAASTQASGCLLAGKLRPAAALIGHAQALAARYGSARTAIQVNLALAILRRGLGVPAEAAEAGREALRLAASLRLRREEALARRVLGDCAAVMGAPREAREHMLMALTLFEEIGADLESARTCVDLAGLAMAQARIEEARALLMSAIPILAERGAALDRANAEQLVARLPLAGTTRH